MVYPYSRDYEPVTVTIVNRRKIYQHPYGKNYILFIHNGLNMLLQEPYLLCSNQLRFNDISVNDSPRHLYPERESPNYINVPIN